jgi:hypothetical protein
MVFACKDDGLEVLCSAVHSLLSSATLEQAATLDVKCKNTYLTLIYSIFGDYMCFKKETQFEKINCRKRNDIFILRSTLKNE